MAETNPEKPTDPVKAPSPGELRERLDEFAVKLGSILPDLDQRTRAGKRVGEVLDGLVNLIEVTEAMPDTFIAPGELSGQQQSTAKVEQSTDGGAVDPLEEVNQELENLLPLTEDEKDYLLAFTEALCDPELRVEEVKEVFEQHLHDEDISEERALTAMQGLYVKGLLEAARGTRSEHLPHDLRFVAFAYVQKYHPELYDELFSFKLNIGGRGVHRSGLRIQDDVWRAFPIRDSLDMLIAANSKLGILPVDQAEEAFLNSGIAEDRLGYFMDTCRRLDLLERKLDRRSGRHYSLLMRRVAYYKAKAEDLAEVSQ